MADGRPKLRAGVALAALHLNVFSHELLSATVQIPRDGFAPPLVLRELMAAALTLGTATSEIGIFGHRCLSQRPLRADIVL